MAEADDMMIEALLDDVLDQTLLTDAVDEAVRIIQGGGTAVLERQALIDAEIANVDAKRTRLVSAIAAGGQLPGWRRNGTRCALDVAWRRLRPIVSVTSCWHWPASGSAC
jgi:hypothetical protein